MVTTRRDFLKQAGWTLLGGGIIGAVAQLPVRSALASLPPREHLFAYIVDTTRCIGCGSCVDACGKENKVPAGCYRTWVERYAISIDYKVEVISPDGGENGFPALEKNSQLERSFFVPKLCNHCRKPNCVQVCPVGATYVSSQGIVLVDEKQCVGCAYCIQACPYSARFMNPQLHVADKCTWCYHRVLKGLKPACVTVCPVGARQFGRVDDVKDPVGILLKKDSLQVLKPEMGNEPMVYYKGLDKEVR